jgi:hypothetical protein
MLLTPYAVALLACPYIADPYPHVYRPPTETSFAILALNGTSQLRALHFPSDIYSHLISTIKQTWPEGIEWATLQSDDGWTCLLRGTPWKKKGTEELE